jgi:hypothetical protein
VLCCLNEKVYSFDGRFLLSSKVSNTFTASCHPLTIFGEYCFIIFNIFQSISLVLLVIIAIKKVGTFFADWKGRHLGKGVSWVELFYLDVLYSG